MHIREKANKMDALCNAGCVKAHADINLTFVDFMQHPERFIFLADRFHGDTTNFQNRFMIRGKTLNTISSIHDLVSQL